MVENNGNTTDGGSGPVSELEIPEELKERARGFFRKGSEVAYALQYDYAIELYLDGLNAWPTALEEGHKQLREIALRRQTAGGKKSGFSDNSRYKKISGKSPREAMLKAEYLLGKDPSNPSHMTNMIKGALDGGYLKTAFWMAGLLFERNMQQDKPNLQTYVFLRDSYVKLEEFAWAVRACQLALQIKPNDTALSESLRDLSANATMQDGKYDSEGDFRDSIKDRENQDDLHGQELVMRSEKRQAHMVDLARKEYLANPTETSKINALIDILCEKEIKESEDEAIDILEKVYAQLDQFAFKKKAGEIRIKQLGRNVRTLKKKIQQNKNDETLKRKLQQAQSQVLQTEIEHHKLCTEKYPTDMGIRFEYGKRLLRARRYDEAIPIFQEARRNPRHRLASLSNIGQCFFYKKWYADAVETFDQALELVETQESALAKELRYNLGRAYEADGKIEEALKSFRKVAQIDFNYLDVRKRIDELRNQQKNG
ncbi:tetratricopeptide repeat protein [Planctomycetota bacterium]